MQRNLAGLAAVTAALGLTSDDAARLTGLIASASRLIYSVIQRPYLFRHAYGDVYDGSGGNRQVLRNWPVLSVESLTIGTSAVPPAPAFGRPGFRLDPWDGFLPGGPQSLTLSGYGFCRGSSNVAVSYTAGYAVSAEAHTIPSAAAYTVAVDAPLGPWAVDDGVSFADTGVLLTRATGSPAQGQYSVSDGTYAFNAADASRPVLISYSYVPADVEQAVIAVVGGAFDSDFTGNVKTLKAGDATVERFSSSAVSQDVLSLLAPYKSVVSV